MDRRLTVLIPVAAGCWAVAAFASVSILDTFRLMIINDIEGWGDCTGALEGGVTLFVFAVVAASLLDVAVGWRATTVFSTFRASASVSGVVASGGAAIGLAVAWLGGRWTAPRAVGRRVSEWTGTSDWGPLEWVAYAAPWLAPLVCALIAAITLGAFVRTHAGTRRAATKAREITRYGQRMSGTIIHVIFTNTWVRSNPQFSVTVLYNSTLGPRQVTELFATPVTAAPVVGGQVDVWYDPLGEEGMVLVELTERSSTHLINPGLFPY